MPDAVIVAAVLLAAAGYLAWRFRPRRRRASPLPCAGCSHQERHLKRTA